MQTRAPAIAPARYRYGAVFVLALTLLAFIILAPSGDLSRAVALLHESAALVVAIATSRERSTVVGKLRRAPDGLT